MPIPLPALNVQPPQQPDVLGQLSKIRMLQAMGQEQQLRQQQLQGAQLENQQRQLDMQSQQAVMRAYQESDGDLTKTLPLAAKYGARPDALIKLKEASINQQKQNIDLLNAKGQRALQEADLMQGAHDQLAKLPPEQRAAAYPLAIQKLAEAGVDTSNMPQQYPGDDAFQLGGIALKGHKQQLEELAKQAELEKTQAQTQQAQATTKKTNLEAEMGGSSSDASRFIFDYIRANNLPNTPESRQKAFDVYNQKVRIQPGVARANVYIGGRMVQVADPNNPGQTIMVPQNEAAGMAGAQSASVAVPKAEQRYMTSGAGGKQLTAFNTAMAHLNTLDRLASDLNNGNIQIFNRAAQKWAQETGNPAPANFEAAKNAMSGEVGAALKASGVTDQEIAKVDSTFSRAQSPAQLRGAINTYRELLRGKRDQLKQQYEGGMQGKPNFGQEQSASDNGSDWFSQHGGKKLK